MPGNHDQTIAALATPPGEAGIAVIRVSGSGALNILDAVFRNKYGDAHNGEWKHRRLHHGVIRNPDGEVIDEVMCAVMRAPDSYTGEDTVEISCHGGSVVVAGVLDVVFAAGARLAEPGEFTKRAFLNGKIDLIQAEAVCDLIHARSDLQRQVAHAQLEGALSERINRLADELLGVLGEIEGNIDFIEEGIDALDIDAALATVRNHQQLLDNLLASAPLSRPFREGYRVVIAGPVNAGKSSLFNKLIGERRAIVTEIPGTTRDVLREPVLLEKVLFVLQDTAGLRGTDDRVERIGVSLAESTADAADVVLFIIDRSETIDGETTSRLAGLDPARSIVALNKIDLPANVTPDKLGTTYPDLEIVSLSVKTGDGIAELERALVERVGRDQLNWIARERVVLNSRLIATLKAARKQLAVLEANLTGRAALELLAVDAREVLSHYETATGRRYTDDLLDTIFSRFCIGK
ncbi:MAG: tRNA uridine-5-carboxymethylaminomethyl(34) synthesis GTPase MnmE [Candidatus Latescibacterota bacterium]|nr:MAG: tRNA uridine-5-carboxymethylaminomethyl(34) synthesis GTPase MnmE [Candidatus Latescibacterota bacterium]